MERKRRRALVAGLAVLTMICTTGYAAHLGIARGIIDILPGVDEEGNLDFFERASFGEGIAIKHRFSGLMLQTTRGVVINDSDRAQLFRNIGSIVNDPDSGGLSFATSDLYFVSRNGNARLTSVFNPFFAPQPNPMTPQNPMNPGLF